MVEIALSIGILAVGAVSIISSLPTGIKQNKISMGQNYAAHAAESLQSYITWKSSISNTYWNNVISSIPSSMPVESSTSKMDAASWGPKTTSNSLWLEGDTFKPNATPGVYGIRMQTSVAQGYASNDFTGELLIWWSLLDGVYYNGRLSIPPKEKAAGIHIEISWPVEVPYGNRQKRYYYFEIYNFNNP